MIILIFGKIVKLHIVKFYNNNASEWYMPYVDDIVYWEYLFFSSQSSR